MEEAIDYPAVVAQLQLENELLRLHYKAFTQAREDLYKIPETLADVWHKLTANKMRLLLGLMIVYWAATIALMFYDRVRGWFE